MNERIPFDLLMLDICDIIAKRSTCLKSKIGSILVKDGRIISSGWNGVLTKFKHCEEPKDCPRWNIQSGTRYEIGDCQHSETSCILQAAKHGISTIGCTLYINSGCCRICARNIISAGIIKVIYRGPYYDGVELLKKANVECIQFKGEQNV